MGGRYRAGITHRYRGRGRGRSVGVRSVEGRSVGVRTIGGWLRPPYLFAVAPRRSHLVFSASVPRGRLRVSLSPQA